MPRVATKKELVQRTEPISNVIAFPLAAPVNRIPLTPSQASQARKGEITTLTVAGDGFTEAGVYDGDRLLCLKKFSRSQIRKDTVCLVEIDGENYLRHLTFEGDRVRLHDCWSMGLKDRETLPMDRVEIKAIVLEMIRKPNWYGFSRY